MHHSPLDALETKKCNTEKSVGNISILVSTKEQERLHGYDDEMSFCINLLNQCFLLLMPDQNVPEKESDRRLKMLVASHSEEPQMKGLV